MAFGSLENQQNDSYTRVETLSDTTKELFGQGPEAVPDVIFSLIGNRLYSEFVVYRWKRTKTTYTYNPPTVESSQTNCFQVNPHVTVRANFSYGDNITNDGNLTGNVGSYTLTGSNVGAESEMVSYLKYKYFKINSTQGLQNIQGYGPWYQLRDTGESVVHQFSARRVTINSVPHVTTEYLQSPKPDAYPNSGTQDGWTYATLEPIVSKIPFMASGSYVGNGNSGVNYKNSLSFDFIPKCLIVWNKDNPLQYTLLWGHSSTVGIFLNQASLTSPIFSLSDKTLTWYSTQNPAIQQNGNNVTYCYIALG